MALDQLVGTITVGDLKELMREVVREERHREYYIDKEGYLVFLSEDAYADYLDKQEGKLPSEVRAYFIDEQGYKAFYSNWVPTPEYARELDEARREIAEGKVHAFKDVGKELGPGRQLVYEVPISDRAKKRLSKVPGAR